MSSDPSDLDITTMALFQSNDLVDVIDQDDGGDGNVRVEVVDGIGNKRSGSWTDLPFQPIYERLPDAATTPDAADRKRKKEEERFYELIHPGIRVSLVCVCVYVYVCFVLCFSLYVIAEESLFPIFLTHLSNFC